ncbi:MAG: hypothetical protein QW812_04000, partial [Thermoplasmataceae archaeon]
LLSLFLPPLLKATGCDSELKHIRAVLGTEVRRDHNKWNLIPVILIADRTIVAVPVHGLSGSISRFLNTSGYISLEPGDVVPAGTEVEVTLFGRSENIKRPVLFGRVNNSLVRALDSFKVSLKTVKSDEDTAVRLLRGSLADAACLSSEYIALHPEVLREFNAIRLSDLEQSRETEQRGSDPKIALYLVLPSGSDLLSAVGRNTTA